MHVLTPRSGGRYLPLGYSIAIAGSWADNTNPDRP
jgi:hypothetical protein